MSEEPKPRQLLFVPILAALVAGGGSPILYRQVFPPATDRFTGSEARAMKDGLRRDIDKNSLAIVDDRKRHDSEISETKARCRVIESRLGAVESGQTAMVRTLENVRDSLHRIEINITRFCPHREFDHNSLQRRGGAIIPNIRPGDLRVPASVPRG